MNNAEKMCSADALSSNSDGNPYHIALYNFDLTADRLNLDNNIACRIKYPERELTVNFPVKMRGGKIQVFTGHRVQHNTARGPGKGGIRYHPEANLDHCRALAIWMTWKCAITGIPFGGSKGCVTCNTLEMNQPEIESLTRRFTSEISIIIGPEKDIPAPDMYTNAQTMAWMMDTYSAGKGYCVQGVVTGKPLSIGGSLGRSEATGRGVVFSVESACSYLGINLNKSTVAVQGFGKVARACAKYLQRLGAKIIAVSNSKGGLKNENGLDIEDLMNFQQQTGTITGYPNADAVTNKELLGLNVDILIPAAIENQITSKNASSIKAKIVAEGANGPTTPEADRILMDNGIFVVPDILANAGGVTVSYFEWVQNIQHLFWNEEDVVSKLRSIMNKAFYDVVSVSNKNNVDNRLAANMLAVSRVAEAIKSRGIYP